MFFELKIIKPPSRNIFSSVVELLSPSESNPGSIKGDRGRVSIVLDKGSKQIELKKAHEIKVFYEGYRGEVIFNFFPSSSRGRGIHFLPGNENKLQFNYEGKEYELFFYLKNSKERNDLKLLINWCYTSGIFLKEFKRGRRTIGLKKARYNDFQKLKQLIEQIQIKNGQGDRSEIINQ